MNLVKMGLYKEVERCDMKDFSQVLGQLARLVQYSGSASEKSDPLLLIGVHFLRGLILALVAGLTLWIVRHPILSPLLATVTVSLARGFLLNWRDRLVPWRLLGLYFPGLGEGVRSGSEQYFQTSLMNWVILVRPALYFFILQSGCWYWLLPVSVLAGAFGHELTSHTTSGKTEWQPWAAAVIITLLVLLAGKFHSTGLVYFPIGLLTCIATWLLSTWMKRLPVRPQNLLNAVYLGELAVCLFFLIGIAF